MTAVAFDGSKYHLPASSELRQAFDPNSVLTFPGKGHSALPGLDRIRCLSTVTYRSSDQSLGGRQ